MNWKNGWPRFLGALLVISGLPLLLSAQDPSAGKSYHAYGVQARQGTEGRGILFTLLEAVVVEKTEYGRNVVYRQYRDQIVENGEAFRSVHAEAEVEWIGDQMDFVLRPQPLRKVSVSFAGKTIRHLNEGIGPTTSEKMPASLEDPILLEDTFVHSFQEAFDRFAERHRKKAAADPSLVSKHPLDGVSFEAVVPRPLQSYTFQIKVEGKETLSLPGGPMETTRVIVNRTEPPSSSMPPNPQLDWRRDFWLTDDLVIVKVEQPHQPRFRGSWVGYNLAYYPGFAGEYSETINFPTPDGQAREVVYSTNDARPYVDSSLAAEKRPLVIFLDDSALDKEDENTEGRRVAARWVVHRTRWELAPMGLRFATVPVRDADPTEEVAAVRDVLSVLRHRSGVNPEKTILISYGRSTPLALRLLESGEFNGWISVNGQLDGVPEPPVESLQSLFESSSIPVLAVWGDAGEGPRLEGRRRFGQTLATAGKDRVELAALSRVDVRLRLTGELEAPRMVSFTGLSLGYSRGITRWMRGKM